MKFIKNILNIIMLPYSIIFLIIVIYITIKGE